MPRFKCGNSADANPKLENWKVKATGNEVKRRAGEGWNVKTKWAFSMKYTSRCPGWLRTQGGSFCGTFRILFGKGTHLFPTDSLIVNTWAITHSGHSDNDHKHVSSLLQRLWRLQSTFPSVFSLNPHTYREVEMLCTCTGKATAVNSNSPSLHVTTAAGAATTPTQTSLMTTRAHAWSLHYPRPSHPDQGGQFLQWLMSTHTRLCYLCNKTHVGMNVVQGSQRICPCCIWIWQHEYWSPLYSGVADGNSSSIVTGPQLLQL